MPSSRAQVYRTADAARMQTVKIREGKVWVNGNLLPSEKLPSDLRNLTPTVSFDASLSGLSELRFWLNGKEYQLKEGTLRAVPFPVSPDTEGNSSLQSTLLNGDALQSRQTYYLNQKQDNPDQFRKGVDEGRLYEDCMALSREYLDAGLDRRPAILEKLRARLDLWFEANLNNREQDVETTRRELDEIGRELEFRRRNKTAIIENRIRELTGY